MEITTQMERDPSGEFISSLSFRIAINRRRI